VGGGTSAPPCMPVVWSALGTRLVERSLDWLGHWTLHQLLQGSGKGCPACPSCPELPVVHCPSLPSVECVCSRPTADFLAGVVWIAWFVLCIVISFAAGYAYRGRAPDKQRKEKEKVIVNDRITEQKAPKPAAVAEQRTIGEEARAQIAYLRQRHGIAR
jgi:hypothetical protein